MAELAVATEAFEAIDAEYAGDEVDTGEESVVVVALDPVMFPLTAPLGPTSTAVASAGPVPVFSTAAKHEG